MAYGFDFNIGGTLLSGITKAVSLFGDAEQAAGIFDKKLDLIPKSVNEINKELRELKKQRDASLDPKSITKFNSEIANLEQQLKRLKTGSVGLPSPDVGSFKSAVKTGVTDSIMGAMPMLGSLGPAISNPYVAAGAAIVGVGAVAVKVGSHAIQVSEVIDEKARKMSLTFGIARQDAERLLPAAIAIEKVFKSDYNETLRAANAITKQFGKDSSISFSLIEKGFKAGANIGGDMLDQIREYSSQMKDIGLTASQQIALIQQQSILGVKDDKGLDAFKEFGLQIREQTKPVQDSLKKAFGSKFTDNLLKKVKTGEIEVLDAMKSISTGLSKLEDKSKVQEVISTLFSGAGEDAGQQFLKNISKINLDLDSLVSKNSGVNNSLSMQLDIQKRIASSQLKFAPTWKKISDVIGIVKGEVQIFFYEGIGLITPFISELFGVESGVMSIGTGVQILRGYFSYLMARMRIGLNLIMIPIRQSRNLLKGIVWVVNKIGERFGITGNTITAVLEKIRPFLERTTNVAVALADALYKIVTLDLSSLSFDKIKDAFAGRTAKFGAFQDLESTEQKSESSTNNNIGDLGIDAGIASVQGESREVKEINISVNKLAEISFMTNNVNESYERIEEVINETLLRLLNNSNAIVR